jgi:cytochrome c553
MKKRNIILNTAFVLVCLTLLLILLEAPDETTARLPADDQHRQFQSDNLSKKEAESHCGECHGANGQAPLSDKHPPSYRCLFCHKRQR